MTPSLKWTLIAVGALLFSALLMAGGYYTYTTLSQVHDENVDQLSEFGSKVTPLNQAHVTQGTQGQFQHPPSIMPEKLSEQERVIRALSEEKQRLLEELSAAQERVQLLEKELEQLAAYQKENERFAPRSMKEEAARAHDYLTNYLAARPEARRFSSFERRAMALGGSWIYRQMLVRYRLSFSETQKKRLLEEHLPAYTFCLGDGIPFVVNSQKERAALLDYFDSGDTARLSSTLREDLHTISSPCIEDLNNRVNQLIGLARS